jgi:hypothetical protein
LDFIFNCFSTIAFAEKLAVFPDLKRPRSIIIDHDRMYIPDCPEIYIYSLKDFKLIKKFGRAGAGPGEFRPTVIHFKINVQPDYIFVNSTNKASYFTKEGNLIREMNAGGIGHGFYAFGDRLVFPEYLPAIWGLKYHCREENEELYVLSRKTRDNKKEFLVFNIQGKLLKKIYLPLKEKNVNSLFPFDIKDGKLYQLIENGDTEEYELFVTEIQ